MNQRREEKLLQKEKAHQYKIERENNRQAQIL